MQVVLASDSPIVVGIIFYRCRGTTPVVADTYSCCSGNFLHLWSCALQRKVGMWPLFCFLPPELTHGWLMAALLSTNALIAKWNGNADGSRRTSLSKFHTT